MATRKPAAPAKRAVDPNPRGPLPGPLTRNSSWERREEELVAHGWHDAGDSKIMGWEENREISGVLVKLKDGKFGPLAVLRLEDGATQTVGCPTVLADRLSNVPLGNEVFIRCTGTLVTEKGQSAWMFKVYSRPPQAAVQEEIPF